MSKGNVKNNRRHTKRVAARHAGKRQKPALLDHLRMTYPRHATATAKHAQSDSDDNYMGGGANQSIDSAYEQYGGMGYS